MYKRQDLNLKRFFAAGGRLSADEVRAVIRALSEMDEPVAARELAAQSKLSVTKTNSAVARLEDEGVIERSADGQIALAVGAVNLAARVDNAVSAQQELREAHRARIEPIQRFARTRDCRRALLLEYFGEQLDKPCGGCDNCDLQERSKQPAA